VERFRADDDGLSLPRFPGQGWCVDHATEAMAS
jgi:hypothetical protein